MKYLADYDIGQPLPAIRLEVDRETLRRYAQASADHNPIHLSDEAARAAGLDGVVAHGMWTMGAALRVVSEILAPGDQIISYFVRFAHPVLVGCEGSTFVDVEAKITDCDRQEGIVTVVIEPRCDGVKVLSAVTVKVRVAQ